MPWVYPRRPCGACGGTHDVCVMSAERPGKADHEFTCPTAGATHVIRTRELSPYESKVCPPGAVRAAPSRSA